MKLTMSEKAEVMKQVKESIDRDYMEKEDAVVIFEVLGNAAQREKERILAENPWLKESEIVQ